jgi:L-lactate dehydrogenase complex protein LldE
MSTRVFELSQYVVDILGIEDVGASFSCKAAYHESCRNLRDLGVSEQPKKLIEAVNGTKLVPLNEADVCCGFGGDFSINFPSISEEIVKQKTKHFLDSNADMLILSEPGCLLNIRGYLSRYHPGKKAIHIASLLVSDFQRV